MAMSAPEQNEYVTGNVPLVAWLKICGHKPIGIYPTTSTRPGRQFYEWVFDDNEQVQDHIREYMTGTARVEPNGFATLIQELFKELREIIEDSRFNR